MMKSRDKESIVVESSCSSGTVRSHITVSRDLRKYFKYFEFWSRYDTEIFANTSILNIPVLSIVLPLAWVTGANVYVRDLDRKFAQSMDVVHREYMMYPGLPYNSNLVADRFVDNDYGSNETALLFSGGLDSTYSLFQNLPLKPRLIMIFGTADIPISNIAFQETLEEEYSDFAEREGLKLNFVRTNMLEVLNMRRIDHLFGSLSRFQRPERHVWRDHWLDYWIAMGYSLAHICQAAPLSTTRFNQLIVAGAMLSGLSLDELKTCKMKYDSEYVARKIAWANLRVIQDGNIGREPKAIFLKQFSDSNRVKLRVCLDCHLLYSKRKLPHPTQLNCNHCWKCLMSIAECALAGINPNECGFSVNRSTYDQIQNSLAGSRWEMIALWWKPLQQAIREETELDVDDSREFFVWLSRVNIDSMLSRLPPYSSPLSSIYHTLPYPIADILRRVIERIPVKLRCYADLALARAPAG